MDERAVGWLPLVRRWPLQSCTDHSQTHPMPNAAAVAPPHPSSLPSLPSSAFECFQSRMKDSSSNFSIGVVVGRPRQFAQICPRSSRRPRRPRPLKKDDGNAFQERTASAVYVGLGWETNERSRSGRGRSRSSMSNSNVMWSANGWVSGRRARAAGGRGADAKSVTKEFLHMQISGGFLSHLDA